MNAIDEAYQARAEWKAHNAVDTPYWRMSQEFFRGIVDDWVDTMPEEIRETVRRERYELWGQDGHRLLGFPVVCDGNAVGFVLEHTERLDWVCSVTEPPEAESWMGSGLPDWLSARLDPAIYDESFTTEPRPMDTPLGDMEIEPVRLDECWRCSVTIPKEDPLGLCEPCRVHLRNL